MSYPTTALVRIENILKDVKNISKTVVNLKLQFNPDKVNIPYLSGYFSKSLMFKIKDGVIYENPKSI